MQLSGTLKAGHGSRVTVGDNEFTCVYAAGQSEWHARAQEPNRVPAAIERSEFPDDFRDRPTGRPRVIRVVPSAETDRIRSASWLFSAKTRDVLAFGTAVHALFEKVAWIETVDAQDIIRDWVRKSSDTKQVKRDVCEQFMRALESNEVKRALSRPEGNVELWREKDFDAVLESRWITGSFDRVVIVRNGPGKPLRATIIDYKSDRIEAEAELQHAISRYRPQLSLYQQALSRILGLAIAEIKLQLLFTRPGRVYDCN